MNKFRFPFSIIIIIIIISSLISLFSCKSEPQTTITPLKSESDSLAYIIGMSVAENLIAMDSTINFAAVCRAMVDYGSSEALLSLDEARTYYLRYLTYVEPERKRGYEEQYLEELTKTNRDYTRSKSGLTYNIEVIGDESRTPRGVNDLISMRYTISRIDGEQIYSSFEAADTLVAALKDLGEGVQESLKMIGEGGKITAWIPSRLAYGEYGDSLLRVQPFETLYYQMELVGMERNAATKSSRTVNNWK
ncbi:MAG: FKBP-type peptidyl-prolyl cis-trans isomerase [Rikenellaceae bacterium]